MDSTFLIKTDNSTKLASISPERMMELMRDLLKVYGNFIREVGSLEKEHEIDASQLGNIFGKADFSTFLSSLGSLDEKKRLAFISLLSSIGGVTRMFSNPLTLRPSEKISLAAALDKTVKELENAIGPSKVISRPLDIDEQLLERCSNKDYHDVITNAFPILEDRLRAKLSLDKSYYGDRLVDYAFSPKTGKLSLGSEGETQGIHLLLKGAFSLLRNTPSHSIGPDEGSSAAVKMIYLSDFLIKSIERAVVK